MDKYGYIGVETLLAYCENAKEYIITPQDFMNMEMTKEPQWIPCYECAPEEYGEYLITWTTSFSPDRRFIGIAEYDVTYDFTNNEFKGEWILDEYIYNFPDVKIIAWMFLPSPYQEKDE